MEKNNINIISMMNQAKEEEKYKRPRKGEESKLKQHRKTIKPENKQAERQTIKNEILLLADDLYTDKKK